MPDAKITALTAISTVDPAADPLVIVDVSDTSMAASGTTKKSTINQLLGAGGTATLASATISGDLTVDTSTLKVDSANNRVIVGHTSGSSAFQVTNAGAAGFEVQPTGVNSAPAILSYNRSGPAWLQLTYGASSHVFQLSGTDAMTLNSTGLGVGGSPTSKLSIFAGADGDVGFFRGGSTRQLQIGTSATAGYLNADNGSAGFELRVNGTARAYFDTSGNVGIGVTSPATKLDVAGNARVQLAFFTGGSIPGLTNDNPFAYRFPGGGLGLGAATETGTASPIIFYTGQGGVERVRVKGSGQVRFFPLAADPVGAEAGDVYYNSTSNKLKCYNGTTWNDLF